MPMVNYICPDWVEIKVEDCINACRLGSRCVSKPTLMLMSHRRPWRGEVSATQGLNGTRLEYLKITQEYGERPVDRAFALLGTLHHLKHQKIDIPEALMEEALKDEDGTGIPDLLIDGQLWDYKTCAAYKLARVMGKRKEEVPAPELGTFKSGPRKGQPKTKMVWSMVEPDIFDWQMQTNRYAWMYRDIGLEVNEIFVQATIRDFQRTMTPRMYGFDRQIYIVPIPILEKSVVVDYYRDKKAALIECLANEEMPPPCSARETWDGKRCEHYCPVARYCDVGQAATSKPAEGGDDE